MSARRSLILCCVLLVILWSGGAPGVAAPGQQDDPLAEAFARPPDAAKPRTWWHWVSGNVSKEGITADLEAMQRVGLAGAQLFTVDQSDVKGPVKFLSPEWRDLVQHTLREAARLHLEISMEACDGWSESGGPWVTPEEAMQKTVWTERRVSGGQVVTLDLPQPETVRGFYRDIALFAFPTPAAILALPQPKRISANDPHFDGGALLAHSAEGAKLAFDDPKTEQWVQCEYDQPATFRSLRFAMTGEAGALPWQVQASTDGVSFSRIGEVTSGDGTVFTPTTARYFRILRSKGVAKEFAITRLQFGGAILPWARARTGMQVAPEANRFADLALTGDDTVDPAAIVNLTGKQEWQAPPGDYTILRMGHTCTGATTHPSTGAGLECDKLNATAVRHHLENLFGPVLADSPALIGNPLRYILLDSWEAGCENWTPDMAAQFTRRRGYDPTPWLPALAGVFVGSGEMTQRFLWDYHRTLADLVAEMHYGTARDFAHEHGMELMAEASGIWLPTVADQLLCKKYTDVPMGEFWVNHSDKDNADDTKEAASAAHLYGQNIASAESFTSNAARASWKNDPYSLKAMGDRQFCLGINRFIFHRYAHQPWLDRKPGMSMGPWGINFERTNTWWEPGRAWIEYLTRCQYLLRQGRFSADLCYFYGEGAPVCVKHDALVPAPPEGYGYDVCNADVLLNLMTVQGGRIVLPDGMNYRVLVLPPEDRLSLPVLKKIESLVRAGATVYGPKPVHAPGLMGNPDADGELMRIADAIWGDCDGKTTTQHTYGQGRIVWGAPLAQAMEAGPDMEPGPDFDGAGSGLSFIHRQTDAADIYFVANPKAEALDAVCKFRVSGKVPELWHPDTGKHETLAFYDCMRGHTKVPLHFDPSGSVFVVFRCDIPASATLVAGVKRNGENLPSADGNLSVLEGGQIGMTVFKNGVYELLTEEGQTRKAEVAGLPESQVLTGPWQTAFPPGLGAPATATFDSLISWTDSPDAGVKYFSGTATYRKEFSLPAEYVGKARRCYLDLGTVKNLAEVTINGKNCGILWKAPFRVDVTDAIQAGVNQLEVKVTNLWPNRLIRDQQLPEKERITWTSVSLYKAEDPLLPSGLLGPVTIVPAEEISF